MASFDEVMKTINRRIGQLLKGGEKDVAKKYAKALTEIRSILAKQYDKYEQGGELTLAEMLKHDRLKKMIQEINFLLKTHYKDIYKQMEKILGGAYEDGFYMTAWAVETETKTKLGYTSVRPETMQAMINNPVAGLTLNERLEQMRVNIIYKIQQEVTQGLHKNETYSTMAKRLKLALEGDTVKAMRIVRTEGHRVQESAKHDAASHAHSNGVVMMKQWNSLEDSRVRATKNANHRILDKVKIKQDQSFQGLGGYGPAPGQMGSASEDINCRCFLTYEVTEIQKPQYKDLENMAFDAWKKERLKS